MSGLPGRSRGRRSLSGPAERPRSLPGKRPFANQRRRFNRDIDHRGAHPARRRAAVDDVVDAISQLLSDRLRRRRGRHSAAVGARSRNRVAQAACKLSGHPVVRHPDAHGWKAACKRSGQIARSRRDQGQRTGQEFFGQCATRGRQPAHVPVDVGDFGDEKGQRRVRTAALDSEHPRDSRGVEGRGHYPVQRVRGRGDDSAATEYPGRLLDRHVQRSHG